jgi:DNA-binding MarR family transcriptional regulator
MKPRTPQFGAILFRANELIGRQGAEAFDKLGVDLHASKISIVLTLEKFGPLTSSEIAERIGHSRQLIESRLKSSVKDGFFVSYEDPQDARRRVYDFSDEARPIVKRIMSIMVDFETVYAELLREIGLDLEEGLRRMEKALSKSPLIDRLSSHFPAYQSEVVEDEYV